MDKWQNVALEEQETTINIDYCSKTISLYTSRKTTANKLKNAMGEPTKTEYTNKKISGVIYKRNVDDKDAKKLLSKGLLIGAIKSNSTDKNEVE